MSSIANGHGPEPGPDGDVDGPPAVPELMTVAEVSALARVSKMTIYRLVHSGQLPATRVRRSLRIPTDAVRDLLRNDGS